jgi:hypothetical protein
MSDGSQTTRANANPPSKRFPLFLKLVGVAFLLLLVAMLLFPTLATSDRAAARNHCTNNLRNIR